MTAGMNAPAEYVAENGATLGAIRNGLREVLRLRPEKRGRELGFYDTFDWRLFGAGWTVEIERLEGGGYRANCRGMRGGRVLSQRLDRIPERLAEWPAGRLHEQLSKTAGVRELVPVATLRGSREHFSVLNGDDKTISHLTIDDWRVCNGSKKPDDALKSRILLTPLKGWEKETGHLAGSITGANVRPASRTLLESALQRLGRQPLDYSSKLDIELSPGSPASAAVRTILLDLLATMCANESGTKRAVDTEFLHDFRVAVRRTRSALGRIKGVFKPESTAWFREELAWLGRATGRKRDLDVQLLEFDDQKALLPEELRGDLEPLRAFLEKKQASAGRELNQVLASERYRRLVREWRRFLETEDRQAESPAAARPIKEVADKRIWKEFHKVIKKGEAIHDESPPEDLHELRKSCKKLRYLMEFFANLYPEKKVGKTIKQLKRLQDNLGDFQDQAVQITKLRGFAEEMNLQHAEPKVLMAIGALIERIADQHTRTRAEFAERFERFARPGNRKLFAGLFKPNRSSENRRAVQH